MVILNEKPIISTQGYRSLCPVFTQILMHISTASTLHDTKEHHSVVFLFLFVGFLISKSSTAEPKLKGDMKILQTTD